MTSYTHLIFVLDRIIDEVSLKCNGIEKYDTFKERKLYLPFSVISLKPLLFVLCVFLKRGNSSEL